MRTWLFGALLLAPSLAFGSGTVTVRNDGSGDYETIGAAVAAAEADDCITTIDVGAGTWTEQVDLRNLEVTLVGAGTGQTVIDGDGQGPVLRLGPFASEGAVQGLTIQNGTSSTAGGCVSVTNASPVFEDVVVRECTAPEGGCIALTDSEATLRRVLVHDCEASSIDANGDEGGNGGGILISGGDVSLTQVKVFDAQAPGVGGAVAYVGAQGELESVWLRDSEADWGGGLGVILGSSVSGTGVSVTDSRVCNGGGAISVYFDSTLVLDGVTANANQALPPTGACAEGLGVGAGGLWAHSNANVTIRGGQFVGNSASNHGGAAWVSHDSGGRFEMVRVVDNSAGGEGGGLMARFLDPGNTDPDLDVIACHITGNEAGTVGGGLHLLVDEGSVRGNWILDNSAGTAGGGGAFDSDQGGVEATNNLFIENQAGHAAGATIQGLNMRFTANTFASGLCTDQAAESGVLAIRTQALGSSLSLVSTVIGDASGCDYAAQAVVPIAGGTGVTTSHGLFGAGSDGTLNPGMANAVGTASQPYYVDPLDEPVFAGSVTASVEGSQLVAQKDDRDGVDEGPAALGDDPDGTAADFGAWGGNGAAVWTEDRDEDGATVYAGDCDDQNGAVHPLAEELCNCIDDDCDGTVDEGCDAEGPCWTEGAAGDDDDAADDDDSGDGDDDDSASAWMPPPGCISECGVVAGGAGGGWLLILGVLGWRRRR